MRDIKNIRNIGIIAHIDAGKTTTTERILYYTGVIHKIGEVHEGESITDWMVQEKERGITITSAAISCTWKKNEINIIDTPGHVDFTIEVLRSLRILDGVVCVLESVGGVQTQTCTVWRQARRYKVPGIFFINKMDRMGANFEGAVESIEEKLNEIPAVLQIPVGAESDFSGLIDLVQMKYLFWPEKIDPKIVDISKEYQTLDIPQEYLETANKCREKLVETVVTADDDILTKYFNEGTISEEDLKTCIRKGTLDCKFRPILCGSAYKNKGIQPVLDAVGDYLPNPLDKEEIVGMTRTEEKVIRKVSEKEELCGFTFKVMNDAYVGSLSFIRIYSGVLNAGDKIFVPRLNKEIRIGRIVRMRSNDREEIKVASAGDIVAVIGTELITGDTFYIGEEIILESLEVPDSVISQAITPKTTDDYNRMGAVLNKLKYEDPSFSFFVDSESGQTIISGMGELHLEILVDRMKREFKVEVIPGAPQVAYRSTPTKKVIEFSYLHKKQSGGAGQLAGVTLSLYPKDRGTGILFKNKIVGAAIESEHIPSVEKGIKEESRRGPLLGSPVTDFEVILTDGEKHSVDSSSLAFEIAGRSAIREIFKEAAIELLEPIMEVEIEFPVDYMGTVSADFNRRRGTMTDSVESNGYISMVGTIPLAEMFGYITSLRAMTHGKGTYTMKFNCYKEVPVFVVENLVKNYSKK